MSLYRKQPLMNEQVARFNKIKSILDGPVIKGVKLQDPSETLYKTKPRNRIDYERQFTKNRKNLEWKNNW